MTLQRRVRYHAKKIGVEIHVGTDIDDSVYVDVHSVDPVEVNAVQNAISMGMPDCYVTNPMHQGLVRRLYVGLGEP